MTQKNSKTSDSEKEDCVRSSDKVRLGRKLSYGTGNIAATIGKLTPKTFSYQVYNIELGILSPTMIGFVIFLSRLIDAVTDPLMGDISDKAKTRWGRRRPFMFIGSILSAVFFALLWMVPTGWSETAYFLYFSLLAVTFYVALTIFTVPWYALGFELTPDYHERTRVMAFPSFFAPIAAVFIGWMYKMTYWDVFTDRLEGIRWVGTGAAAIILVTGLVTTVFTKERPIPPPAAKPKPQDSKEPKSKKSLWRNITEALKCQPFRMLSFIIALVLLGSNMVSGLGSYVMIYYLYSGDKEAASTLIGWHPTVSTVLALILIPIIAKLATSYGKKPILKLAIWIALAGSLGKFVLYTPSSPYLSLIVSLLLAPAMAAIFLLVPAMVADVCDLDELNHHQRREGLFGAVYASLFKIGISIAFLLSGPIITLSGFRQELEGSQSDTTLFWLRIFFAAIPASAFLASLYCVNRYDLDEKKSHTIRASLEERRGRV